MGDYFADKWDALISLPAAIAENPVFFGIVFAIFLPLIWWKWRVTGNSVTHATESLTHGLRASADSKQVKHQTGLGVQDVRVMRPPKTPGMIYFALFFFGGGALFYWLIVLQSGEATSGDWWTFAALSGFAIGAMAVIEVNMTRVIVSATTIENRWVLHKRHTISLTNITSVVPLSKDITRGARLRTSGGDEMKIGANFSGYKDLILRLKGVGRA